MKRKIKRLTIELPSIVTPSGNETRQWDRQRAWSKFTSEKKLYRNLLGLAGACEEKYRCAPHAKRSVEFRSYRKRIIDDDNLVQGFKMLRDMLQEMEIIYRDSPRYLEAHYHQELDRDNPRTELVVRDV